MNVSYDWTVDVDGWVYNSQMERIGYFGVDGAVYAPDQGTRYGFVDVNGDIYDAFNSAKGFVDVDGMMYDESGNVIGNVDVDGLVYNVQQIPIGSVRRKIHPGAQEAELEHRLRKTLYRAAAGVVILLSEHLEQRATRF